MGNLNGNKIVSFMKVNTSEMEGITFIHDQTNDKKYAQIDLELYGEYIEDLMDCLIAESRKDDAKIPIAEVKRMFSSNEL